LSKSNLDDMDDWDLETTFTRWCSEESQMSIDSQPWSYPPGWDEENCPGNSLVEYSINSPDSAPHAEENTEAMVYASTIAAKTSDTSPTRKWADITDKKDTEEPSSGQASAIATQTTEASPTRKWADMTEESDTEESDSHLWGLRPGQASTTGTETPESAATRKWADMTDESDTEESDSHLWGLHPGPGQIQNGKNGQETEKGATQPGVSKGTILESKFEEHSFVGASSLTSLSDTYITHAMTNLNFVVHNTFLHFDEGPLEAEPKRRSSSTSAVRICGV